MNLSDCAPKLADSLTRMASAPESWHPWVRLEAGGNFIQFVGSAEREIAIDLPEQLGMDWEIATSLLGESRYQPDLGLRTFVLSAPNDRPAAIASYAVLLLRKIFALQEETEAQIVTWLKPEDAN